MIISHKYKFIFVKTRKTAGTSIEVFLSGVCGEEDVLMPLDIPEADHCPRNWEHLPVYPDRREHLKASAIKNKIPARVWNNYFKFCVERNPWDKTLSFYHFHTRPDADNPRVAWRGAGLDKFFDVCEEAEYPSDFNRYTDDRGQLMVDKVLRYEWLNQELAQVFGQLGIGFDGALRVRAKGGFRQSRAHYRELLSASQAEHIRRIFCQEIDMFGYVY